MLDMDAHKLRGWFEDRTQTAEFSGVVQQPIEAPEFILQSAAQLLVVLRRGAFQVDGKNRGLRMAGIAEG